MVQLRHLRAFVLLVPFVLLTCPFVGCSSFDTVVLPERTLPGNVFLVTGLIGWGTDNLNGITSDLADDGYNAQTLDGPAVSKLTRELVRAHKAGELEGPIILGGYSLGGRDAVRIARALDPHGIEVDAVIVLDGFAVPLVPGNVATCYNLFKPGIPPLYMGATVDAESGQTAIHNIDLSEEQDDRIDINHFNMTSYESVRHLITNTIRHHLPGEIDDAHAGELAPPGSPGG